MIIKVIK